MFKKPDEQYFRHTRILAVSSCFLYGIVRFIGIAMTTLNYALALKINIMCWMSIALLIALMYILREDNDLLALYVPLLMFLCFTAGALYMRDFQYFFLIFLGICSIGCVYQNFQRLLQFYLAASVIIMVMLLSGLFAFDPFMNVAITTANWIISLFPATLLLMLTYMATEKESNANHAFNTFTTLMATTPNLVVLVDAQNRVTYISKSLAKFAKINDDPEYAMGRPIYTLFKEAAMQKMIGEVLAVDGFYEGTKEIVLEGAPRFFQVVADNFQGMPGKFIDITDITSLAQSKMEAEEANKAKTDFLAMMSHEIRTPLNAIIGLSDANLRHDLPEELRSDMETIRQAGTGLLSIINDTLDISKIEAGGFALVPVEYGVADMISETVQMNLVRIGEKKFYFKLELDRTLPERLFGDEIRVRQILNNLLSNAIKYTPEGGATLSVRWGPEDDGGRLMARLRFTVTDTGIGIRREDMDKLFTEYIQVDTLSNRNIEGTGLGLAITKQLVTMMNGAISVESEYGKGSVFTAEILQGIALSQPLGSEEAARVMARCAYNSARAADMVFTRSLNGKRVLVVDDVPTNLTVAKGLLAPHGVITDCVLRAAEAVEAVRAGEPLYDAILMDHRMPEMSGIEAVRLIRALDTEYARDLPIIALTASESGGSAEMFLASGFNGFIHKPINPRQLDLELGRCLLGAAADDVPLRPEPEQDLPEQSDEWDEVSARINWQDGRRRYGRESFRNILCSFVRHTPEVLLRMESLLPEHMPDYCVAVHGLKSSCYGICAMELGQAAAALEKKSGEGYSEPLQAEHDAFAAEMREMLAELQGLFRTKQDLASKEAPSAEALWQMLDGSRHYRMNRMEEALEELERYVYDDEDGNELVGWLREQTDNLAYGAITRKLAALLNDQEEVLI
ncbi:MAG: response regulator [Gracilibacteraceae bacterium]|nr:response regulator [Gracilibacteraceae bacterium]